MPALPAIIADLVDDHCGLRYRTDGQLSDPVLMSLAVEKTWYTIMVFNSQDSDKLIKSVSATSVALESLDSLESCG